jgi:branched-chain amino acid transport system substrate-binding protein
VRARVGAIILTVVLATLVAVTAAWASPASQAKASKAQAGVFTCKKGVTIGAMAAVTGQGASQGVDQMHWVEFFVDNWNKTHKLKLKLIQGDTQLDPSKASVVAQSFASASRMVGIVGPASSSETVAIEPILQAAGGPALVSASATRVTLTDGHLKGYFWRVVPNDGVQGPTDASFMMSKLGVGSGDKVMIVDDQESYSLGLTQIVQPLLTAKGVNVDHESISQTQTDFSSLIAKVSSSTKVVYLPFQLAAQTQLFAQQLKEQGKSAIAFGTDGSFDISKFNVEGSYASFFAPNVTTIAADRKITKSFLSKYVGETNPFGAPAYVGAQVIAAAITTACKDGKISRAEVRKDIPKVKFKSTILGGPFSFTANGDVNNAAFGVFKIVGGKFVTVG